MPEEKKSRYTEAQAKAAKKYLKESVEDIRIRVPKGNKAKVQDHAAAMGESMNSFVVRAINETMSRDTQKQDLSTACIKKPVLTKEPSDKISHRYETLDEKMERLRKTHTSQKE